jgi:hypothetical protein
MQEASVGRKQGWVSHLVTALLFRKVSYTLALDTFVDSLPPHLQGM